MHCDFVMLLNNTPEFPIFKHPNTKGGEILIC